MVGSPPKTGDRGGPALHFTTSDEVGSRDANVTFEAVGTDDALATAIRLTRPGGTIIIIGNATRMPQVDIQTVVSTELTMVGSYASADEYEQALSAVAAGTIDPSPLISVTSPLKKGPAYFDRLHRAEEDLLKVVLVP